jgi:hypothetical protein
MFEYGCACVASRESKYPQVLTLKQYLAAGHVGVGILGGNLGRQPTIPDKRLAGIGGKRRCAIWVPCFSAAVRCLPGTPSLATVPDGMASAHEYRRRSSVAASRDT